MRRDLEAIAAAALAAVCIATGCNSGGGQGDGSTTGGETETGSSMSNVTTMSTDSGNCPVGAESCPCTGGDGCDPGLACVGGLCVDDGVATSGAATSGGPTSGGTSGSGETAGTGTDSSTEGSSGSTGEPVDLDPWTKRRPLSIDNSNDDALTDHEVIFDLDWDDDMNADLSDLRFTDESGVELLPHWVEGFIAPVSLQVWVRVPQVDANDVGTIYMWYGNAAASDAGDPSATFHFWDDFDGNALDATWTANADVTVANGRLSMTDGSVYTAIPFTEQPGWVVEARARWPGLDPGDGASGMVLGTGQGLVQGVDYLRVYLMSGSFFVDAARDDMSVLGLNLSQNGLAAHPVSEFEWIRLGIGSDLLRVGFTHWTDGPHNYDTNEALEGDFYLWLGSDAGAPSTGPIVDVDYDRVLLRRFEQVRPETFAGAEEDV